MQVIIHQIANQRWTLIWIWRVILINRFGSVQCNAIYMNNHIFFLNSTDMCSIPGNETWCSSVQSDGWQSILSDATECCGAVDREPACVASKVCQLADGLAHARHASLEPKAKYYWCYGKTWRFLCPFFRNLHLRENLARDCFTSTVSTVTNSVQNIFTHLRYYDK